MTPTVFLRAALRVCCLGGACLAAGLAFAQVPQSAYPTETAPENSGVLLDDFTTRQVVAERPVLPYQPVREADILWEKRLWRVIDVREKQNLAFSYPQAPLFQILADAVQAGQLTAYAADDFAEAMPLAEVESRLSETDTLLVYNFNTEQEEVQVIHNTLDPASVRRFRVKEAWWFDTNTGQLRVRILGIAPLVEVERDGEFRYEKPLFWVHYPSARPLLARQKVYWPGDNLATTLSWEDVFEMRRFSSMVYKESNVYDRRLQDYLAGEDIVYEAAKIEDELFNREHDLWSW